MARRGQAPVRGLATILFTDIIDSTPQAAQLGDRKWLTLLNKHHEAARAAFAHNSGREARVVGDGFVAVFDSPTAAISAALEMHDAVEKLHLSIRAGVHVGEVDVDVSKVEPSGLAMNIGARVGALAVGGQTLVTSTVRDLCAGADVVFVDHGLHALRGVPGEWHLFEVDRAAMPRPTRKKATPAPGGASRSRAATKSVPVPISLMLVDDHPMWRETLRKVLERSKVGTVVAEASDGAEALELARAARPEVVIMDMHMSGVDGVDATRALTTELPETKVLVLSSADDREQVLAAVSAGASGYLLKTAASAELIDGVRRVHAGELVFPPALATVVLQELRRMSGQAKS